LSGEVDSKVYDPEMGALLRMPAKLKVMGAPCTVSGLVVARQRARAVKKLKRGVFTAQFLSHERRLMLCHIFLHDSVRV
jgi:hypothetical protein